MYKLVVILFLLSGGVLAYSPLEINSLKKEFPDKELPTTTYRSDQYSPGIVSEYIRITRSSDNSKIVKIEYWYVFRGSGEFPEETEPEEIKFRKGERYEKEEVGYDGELMLPETEVYVPFRIAEGTLEVTHGNERVQIFEMEM